MTYQTVVSVLKLPNVLLLPVRIFCVNPLGYFQTMDKIFDSKVF
jgi:hypothetical protein